MIFLALLSAICYASHSQIYEYVAKGNTTTDKMAFHVTSFTSSKTTRNMFYQDLNSTKVKFDVFFSGPNVKKEDGYYVHIETTKITQEGNDKGYKVRCQHSSEGEVIEKEGGIQIIGEKEITSMDTPFVVFMCVGPEAEGTVSGTVSYQFDHGFIQAGYFGYITFEMLLTSFYAAILGSWMNSMMKPEVTIGIRHKVITVILCFSFVVEIVNFMMLIHDNAVEDVSSLTYLDRTFGSLRETLIRYVGLMFAFGWGIAKADIPEKQLFQGLALMYFILDIGQSSFAKSTMMYEFWTNVKTLFDALWGTVIIRQVNITRNELLEEKQMAKADAYRLITKLSMASLIVGTFFVILARMYVSTNWMLKSPHKMWWFIDGCWRFEVAFVICYATYLFAPTEVSVEKYNQIADNDLSSDECFNEDA